MSIDSLNNSEYVGDACNVAYAMLSDLDNQSTTVLSEIVFSITGNGIENIVSNWDEIQERITDWQDVGMYAMKIRLLHKVLSSIPASDKLSDWDEILSKLVGEP